MSNHAILYSGKQARWVAPAGVFAAIGLTVAGGVPAYAQTVPSPSRVTPENIVPPETREDNDIGLPDTVSTDAPDGADTLYVTLSNIVVEGGSDLPDLQSIINTQQAAIAGKRVSVASLYAMAARIEADYVQRGYVLTRVIVPQQQLVDGGSLRLIVIDGYIESVDASALPERVRDAVLGRANLLVGRRGIRLPQIERHLLLAGDIPGVRLSSTLARGDEMGGTKLVLAGEARPVSASLSADNFVSDQYGDFSISGQLALNSFFGFGELVYFSATTSPRFDIFSSAPRRRVLGAGMVAPIGNNGLTINPEYIRSDTNPRAAAGTTPIQGEYERYALRVAYPVIRSRSENLNITGAFEHITERQRASEFDVTLNEDRLRTIALGLDWAGASKSRLYWYASAQLTQGIDELGARDAGDASRTGIFLSRQGSQPDFTKAKADIRLDGPVGKRLVLSNRLRGQLSLSGALPASAQFALDGEDALSSFTLGSLNADSGISGRTELALPASIKSEGSSVRARPYVFGAFGFGHLSRPTAVERGDFSGWSAAAGIEMTYRPAKSRLTALGALELSHGRTNIFADNDTRINASLSLRI